MGHEGSGLSKDSGIEFSFLQSKHINNWLLFCYVIVV